MAASPSMSAQAFSSRLVDDPNFPPSLRIFSSRAPQHAGDAGSAEADEHIYADEEDIAAYGIAGRIWEAAYLLRLYLRPVHPLLDFSPPCPFFEGPTAPRCVELGAGVGYAGLHLARQLSTHGSSSHLVLTDLHNVLPLLQRNVQRATVAPPASVEVMPLPWSDADCALEVRKRLESGAEDGAEPITHILCSDLVYFPELLAPLLRSLLHLTTCASGSGPTVVIAYKIRSLEKETPFWHAFGTWFEFEPVLCRRKRRRQESEDEWDRFGAKMSHFQSPDGAQPTQALSEEDKGEEAEEQEEENAPDQYFIFIASRRPDTQGALPPSTDAQLLQGWRVWPAIAPATAEGTAPASELREGEEQRQEGRWERGSGGERFEELLFLALDGG